MEKLGAKSLPDLVRLSAGLPGVSVEGGHR
jgi:hypothetical protein